MFSTISICFFALWILVISIITSFGLCYILGEVLKWWGPCWSYWQDDEVLSAQWSAVSSSQYFSQRGFCHFLIHRHILSNFWRTYLYICTLKYVLCAIAVAGIVEDLTVPTTHVWCVLDKMGGAPTLLKKHGVHLAACDLRNLGVNWWHFTRAPISTHGWAVCLCATNMMDYVNRSFKHEIVTSVDLSTMSVLLWSNQMHPLKDTTT